MSNDDEINGVHRLVRGRGVKAAAEALIEVCENPKAPAPARAAAGSTLFRAAGMFEKWQDPDSLSMDEMSPGEFQRRAAQALKRYEELVRLAEQEIEQGYEEDEEEVDDEEEGRGEDGDDEDGDDRDWLFD